MFIILLLRAIYSGLSQLNRYDSLLQVVQRKIFSLNDIWVFIIKIYHKVCDIVLRFSAVNYSEKLIQITCINKKNYTSKFMVEYLIINFLLLLFYAHKLNSSHMERWISVFTYIVIYFLESRQSCILEKQAEIKEPFIGD